MAEFHYATGPENVRHPPTGARRAERNCELCGWTGRRPKRPAKAAQHILIQVSSGPTMARPTRASVLSDLHQRLFLTFIKIVRKKGISSAVSLRRCLDRKASGGRASSMLVLLVTWPDARVSQPL
jgi:hypothetical protein